MMFTYIGDLSTNLDKVRFNLGDVTQGQGLLPGDANFSDEELNGLIAAEGSWQRAVAAGLERLATSWRRYPTSEADGLRLARSDIAKGYAEQAKEWRQRYGGSAAAAGVRHPTRVDGYSDDVAADDV